MKRLHYLGCFFNLSIQSAAYITDPIELIVKVYFVLHNSSIDLIIQLTIINESFPHFLELLHNEMALMNHGLDSNSSPHKDLIDSDKLSQLLVIY